LSSTTVLTSNIEQEEALSRMNIARTGEVNENTANVYDIVFPFYSTAILRCDSTPKSNLMTPDRYYSALTIPLFRDHIG